jgi:hypothetical protein
MVVLVWFCSDVSIVRHTRGWFVSGCFLCCVFSVLYCSVTLYCSVLLFFFCVLYCLFFLYCTASTCDVRAATQTEVFTCFFLSCKAKTRKDGARPAIPKLVDFFNCYVCSFPCILCTVCVYMCAVLLPPSVNPIAVKYHHHNQVT